MAEYGINESWIFKTKAEREQETALSRHEQDTYTAEPKKKRVLNHLRPPGTQTLLQDQFRPLR